MNENTRIEIIADEVITIDKTEYDELRRKAQCLDIIESDIRMKIDRSEPGYSLVNDDLVMLLTGMKAYQMEEHRRIAKRYVERVAAAAGKDEAGE